MHIVSPVRVCLGLILAASAFGCGGGGGGGGGGGNGTTTLPPGSFGVSGGPQGGKIGGLNLPVTLSFSKPVDPATVTPITIKVVSVADPSGIATAPPGHLASVTYAVSGATVKIVPDVEFKPDKVEYGFLGNALYEIAFAPPTAPLSVHSLEHEAMSNPDTTFFFRTPDKGFDFNPGFPHVRAFVVDDPDNPAAPPVVLPPEFVDQDGNGSLVEEVVAVFNDSGAPGGEPLEITQPTSPVTLASTTAMAILFIFDDAVIPSTVVNPLNHDSPSMHVAINAATAPSLAPKQLPAQYAVIHQQGDLTLVLWQTAFVEFPPQGFLFIEVLPTVEDLAGNSKESLLATGEPDLTGSLHIASSSVSSDLLEEPFDDTSQRDVAATSAEWGLVDDASGSPATVLAPVLGGGTGEDGLLVVTAGATAANPGETEVPPAAVIDFTAQTVKLPTVEAAPGGFAPREWSFSTISIPVGWTLGILTDRDGDGTPDPGEYVVQSPGDPLDGQGAPLLLRCTGLIEVMGSIDVSGRAPATLVRPAGPGDPAFASYLGQGAEGGPADVAAGAGGHGGDVLLLDQNGAIAFPLVAPSPDFQSSDGKLRGVTGQTTALSATALTDATQAFSQLGADPVLSGLLAAGELRLQPNLGVGSSLVGNAGTPNENIDENHPTFVLEGVANDETVTIGPQFGDLTQPSKDFGTAYAPIAAAGDCYLVGRLHGRSGDDVAGFARGGAGAEPYVVVNEGALGITTTGGGGGGGGALEPGSAGASDGPDSDPSVNQRGGSHGIAKDDSIGGAGGLGAVRGTATCTGPLTLTLVSQTGGRPLDELAGGELAGSLLVPNTASDGWIFTLAGFDGATFTVESITAGGDSIDLLDGPGIAGPALSPGLTYDFLVLPSLEIGGGGGGGSGVSVTGTVNSAPSVLPQLTPGAGGGSGGGSLLLETASAMQLGPLAQILAEGGDGGLVFDLQAKYAGGGGGGGGNLVIRAGQSFDAFLGARISVAGGPGGSEPGFGQGGAGGAGYMRFENFQDTLSPAVLSQFTTTEVKPENVGRMLGSLQGVGQSLFYQTVFAHPEWKSVDVDYFADTDGDFVTEPFTWGFTDTGAVSTTNPSSGAPAPFPDGLSAPPIRVLFNSVGFDENGFLDQDAKSSVFYEAYDLVSARTGLAFDPTTGVLLYCVGEGAHQVHRLDLSDPGGANYLKPVTVGPKTIVLPIVPSAGTDTLNVLAIAAGGPNNELFLLERDTSRVHVVSLATGLFRRTIQLPVIATGAMTYLPDIDRLVVADNQNDQLLIFRPRDPGGSLTLDYAPGAPEAQYPLRRDADFLDAELVGLAYDAVNQTLWCTDARAGRLFQVSMASGSQGVSVSVLCAFSTLTHDPPGPAAEEGVVPSAVGFDGNSLFLTHAVDRGDSRVRQLTQGDVDPGGTGAGTVLSFFGVLLPEGPASIADGDLFLRFRLLIDGEAFAGSTQFSDVSVDRVGFVLENQAF
jgi:hypothetical protein